MINDNDFKILSDEAYAVDSKVAGNSSWKTGEIIVDVRLTHKFKIIKVEDNITNGMQALAVAPIINGKVDTSEIVIAYAGTNPDDDLDIRTDYQTVVGSKQ